MMKIKKHIFRILPLIAFLAFIYSCVRENKYIHSEGMIWNTSYHITYESTRDLNDSILKILSETGKSLSTFDSSSVISRINRNEDLTPDIHFERILNESKRINRITDGAFDPTLSPLVRAWGFGEGHTPDSDTLRIDSLLMLTGIHKINIIEGKVVKADKRMTMNFSAIAKGYGCDEIGRMMDRNGVKNYMIEIGGEICCKGKNPKGDDWKISIDRPVMSNKEEIHLSQMIIKATDCGIATSGNYRNYRETDGKILAHTISPTTGRPVQTDIISATIIAPSAMEADALATSCMVLGLQRSREIIDSLALPALLILEDEKIWVSTKLKPMIIEQ